MNQYKLSKIGHKGEGRQISEERALEKITSSQTRIYETRNQEYNVDNCSCPPCGCITDDFVIILSPAGVAGAGITFVAASPF